MLLEKFHELLQGWRPAFAQQRTWQRAQRLGYGLLLCLRTHLTSNAICAMGQQFRDWSANYRLFSRSLWNPHALFDPIFDHLAGLLADASAPVVAALDDTLCKKTGRHIPGATIGRDPMSLPFHVNLCRGLRFVQAVVLVRAAQFWGPARALPVRFEPAPPALKPKRLKGASKHHRKNQRDANRKQKRNARQRARATRSQRTPRTAEEKEYRLQKKAHALTQVGVRVLHSLRQALDARPLLRFRLLLASGDGSYTNRAVLRHLPERTTFIGRIRKDAKLCYALAPPTGLHATGRPRRYGPAAPTPQQVLQDDSVPVVRVCCFAAGALREIAVKVVRNLYWRNTGADLPLQLVIVKPLGYRLRKGSKLLYRQPAFLICTDPLLDLQILLQAYVDRWQIECNHRDEKSLIGVAQGQVWSPLAVTRLPQFQVALYSLLMLASLLAYGFQRSAVYLPLPLWRAKAVRPSILDLLNLLRDQIFGHLLQDKPATNMGDFAAWAPADANAAKLPLASDTLCTVAA